ncbi:hypothetical protein BDV95DRAFT_600095 [Massariosphaeria phaeospora]|uniref:Uncharacterized protein n=1 Tax=Massariosphaeria phaeospora TaxID=100035 RepID=A0A7C8HYE8_9PLEO|nr:hypothetical protein BDV95DRAFT_600095 [Massariosphaeria phaeospora]
MFLSRRSLTALLLVALPFVQAAPYPQATVTSKVSVPAPVVTPAPNLLERADIVASDTETRTSTIGYRKVSPDQAKLYNKDNKLVWDLKWKSQGSGKKGAEQIGEGVYISPDDAWPGNTGDWICVIRANPAKFDKIDKIWIPAKNECDERIWWRDNVRIPDHIKDNGLDPDRALRLAIVDSIPGAPTYQILIPPKAIDMLDARVDCFAADDPHWLFKPAADYDNWKNVKNPKDKFNVAW